MYTQKRSAHRIQEKVLEPPRVVLESNLNALKEKQALLTRKSPFQILLI